MFELLTQVRELVFSRVTKDASIVFVGNAVSSALAIVFTIVAARLLGPENWGIVAAVASFTTIIFAVGELGLGAALFRFVSVKWSSGKLGEARTVLSALFTVRVIIGIFLVLALFIFARTLSFLFFDSEETLLVIFAALSLFGFLLMDFQVVTSEVKQNWRQAALFITLTNILRVVFLTVVFLAGIINIMSVLFVFAAAPLLAWFISLFWQRVSIGFVSGWKKMIYEIAIFSSWMSVNRIVSSVNSRVDVLLLLQLAGTYQAGIYSAASSVALGVPLIIGSFATVLAPSYASLGEKALVSYFKRAMGISVIISIGLILGIFIAPLVITLFGPQYASSGVVLQALFAVYIPFALATPAVNLLIYAFQKPYIIAATSLVNLPLVLLANFYLIPKIGVFAPVFALGMVNLLTMIVSFTAALLLLRAQK